MQLIEKTEVDGIKFEIYFRPGITGGMYVLFVNGVQRTVRASLKGAQGSATRFVKRATAAKPHFQKELNKMLALELKAQQLSLQLAGIRHRWETMRDSAFLESDEYREYCDNRGIYRHYNFSDVIC